MAASAIKLWTVYPYQLLRAVGKFSGRDPGWMPLISTPMHPEYPLATMCGLSPAGEAFLAMFSSEIGEVQTLQVAVYGQGDGKSLVGARRSASLLSARVLCD